MLAGLQKRVNLGMGAVNRNDAVLDA
jgi:hypothetical protein